MSSLPILKQKQWIRSHCNLWNTWTWRKSHR